MGYSTKFISYDLKAPHRDYAKLYEYLRSFPVFHKIEESFWMVNSNKASSQIRDELLTLIDNNDSIFVNTYGSNSSAAWHNVSEDIKSDIISED